MAFDFAPQGWNSPGSVDWMGWGILDFDVYNLQSDINQFIDKNYPTYKDKLTVKEESRIGNKPTFLEEGKNDFYWEPRDIILGTNYFYEVGHSQNGSDNFVKDVSTKTGIFSFIQIIYIIKQPALCRESSANGGSSKPPKK